MLGPRPRPMAKDDFDGFRKCDDGRLADGLIGGGNFDVRSIDDLCVVERGKHAAVTFIDLLRISKPQTVRELGVVWIGSGSFGASKEAGTLFVGDGASPAPASLSALSSCMVALMGSSFGERLGVKRGGRNSDSSGSVPLHFEKRRVGKNALPALRVESISKGPASIPRVRLSDPAGFSK